MTGGMRPQYFRSFAACARDFIVRVPSRSSFDCFVILSKYDERTNVFLEGNPSELLWQDSSSSGMTVNKSLVREMNQPSGVCLSDRERNLGRTYCTYPWCSNVSLPSSTGVLEPLYRAAEMLGPSSVLYP